MNHPPDGKSIKFTRNDLKGGFWFKIYDIFVPVAHTAARLASMKRDKLKRTLAGRGRFEQNWNFKRDDDRPVVMIHVASAGEFEGARPIIDRLLKSGKVRVAVSYSSPSAIKSVSSTEGLWASGFLPLDYFTHQLKLLARIEPAVILIFKHDFWPNMLRAAAALNIPAGLVNANFHSKTKRTSFPARYFHRSFMKLLAFVWTVSENDLERIQSLISPGAELTAAGDTRFDRVLNRAEEGKKKFADLKRAFGSSQVIIAGSSWQPGEEIVWKAFTALRKKHSELKLIVAPHEPVKEALERNIAFANAGGFSIRKFSEPVGERIGEDALLIDKVGVLAGLYAAGWAAYVGGGFGKGVHSVIEPAAHCLPVCFGPNHHVSHEASLLIDQGGGFAVRTAEDLINLWGGWLDDPDAYSKAAKAALDIVMRNAGVTDKVIAKIDEMIGGQS